VMLEQSLFPCAAWEPDGIDDNNRCYMRMQPGVGGKSPLLG
jgi:hypothetical protein